MPIAETESVVCALACFVLKKLFWGYNVIRGGVYHSLVWVHGELERGGVIYTDSFVWSERHHDYDK